VDLYTYSNSINDISNCKNYDQFFKHFKFLIPSIYRIIKPGRNIAIHCRDLPIQKGKEGYIGLRDFSGKIIKEFEKEGFIYHSRITIWKNPVTEMQRTKALGLLHKQTKKDATMCRVGIPDYILIFRKDGERRDPVKLNLPVSAWQKIASPVWMDINQSDTLNAKVARENEDEKHLCPLQLPVIERLINLYTNEGDTVFTPFMGIGSEVYQAISIGRKGIGFELKQSYFDTAKNYIESTYNRLKQLGI
jgi:DNA modification methylase